MARHALALRYPDGRVDECDLELVSELRLGAEFALHGRRWIVAGALPLRRGDPRTAPPLRLFCVAARGDEPRASV